MKKYILIATQLFDPHTDNVLAELERQKCEAVRLNRENVPINTSIYAKLDQPQSEHCVAICLENSQLSTEEIKSVWWRRFDSFTLPNTLSTQESEFAQLELEQLFSAYWELLDCYWISFPVNIRRAKWKVEQLQRAAKFGLETPKTIITTNPNAVRDFYEICNGQMIYKVLSDPFLAANKIPQESLDINALRSTQTTLITQQELNMLDNAMLVPCMFQEYIQKLYEFRVTIIGDDIFVAKIHSQSNQKTKIDWRHFDVDILYESAELPSTVLTHCMNFVKSYGLNFSAVDLILTPDGRYVFLENNPNGQFIFVEQRVPELKMTQALVSYLKSGHIA